MLGRRINVTFFRAFIVMFQFGWASTQISHLSLIPVLTVCKRKIVFLNSVRLVHYDISVTGKIQP